MMLNFRIVYVIWPGISSAISRAGAGGIRGSFRGAPSACPWTKKNVAGGVSPIPEYGYGKKDDSRRKQTDQPKYEQKGEKTILEYIPSIILWVIIIGALVYNFVVKKNQNRKEAQAGEDKKRVRQAVEPLLNGAGNFKLVYAHREERESYVHIVKTTYKTTYYRYAVAFQDQTLCAIPLGIDKETRQVQAGKPFVLSADKLGKVTVKAAEKDGAVNQVKVWLGDKQGHTIIDLTVDAESLRKNRWFPVNIAQQEECEAFHRFATALAQQVAKENPGIDAVIEAESGAGLGVVGAALSIGGVVGGIFAPAFGTIPCVFGLILSVVGKVKGAKGKVCLIISVVCAILIAVYWPLYLKYIFV